MLMMPWFDNLMNMQKHWSFEDILWQFVFIQKSALTWAPNQSELAEPVVYFLQNKTWMWPYGQNLTLYVDSLAEDEEVLGET